MDSREDSASVKNSHNLDSDREKNRNYKSGPLQGTVNDHVENLITSSRPASSFVGSRSENTSPLSNSGVDQQNIRSRDNNRDILRNTADTSKNQLSHKVISNNEISENMCSSGGKTSSNLNDNNADSSQDMAAAQKHKVYLNVAENGCSEASTSGLCSVGENAENNVFKENRKRPSSLKLKRPYSENDSSSDTGNDDYSLGSEDGCIYTYRGGEHLADLPSSFFSLDMGLPLDKHLPVPPNYNVPQQGLRDQGSRASSPDMDFLEMDFDPGPSCEADSGEESIPDADLDAPNNMPEESEPELRTTTPENEVVADTPAASSSSAPASAVTISDDAYNMPSTSRSVVASHADVAESVHSYGPYITHINNRGEELLVRRTMSHWPIYIPVSSHVSSGDLVSSRNILNYEDNTDNTLAHQINQGERLSYDSVNFSSTFYHLTMAKKLMAEQTKTENEHHVSMAGDTSAEPSTSTSIGAGCVEPPRCMVWSEREACERQVTQIGTSACGATAVVNVFNALGVPVNLEKISLAVGTRQRANDAPIPRYLLSRAVAGCTAADLVTGINRASDGLVTARFFPTYPERVVSLSHWLSDWISVGAVPILTLNLQIGCEGVIPDAWHHQMVFGVSPRGVYLCNPVECIRENVLWPRLTSPSVLLMRSSDVLSHGAPDADLTPLMYVPDRRFHTFNVLGQVANLLREWQTAGWEECYIRTRYIRIPAAYQAGVTVSALTGSEAHRRLTLAAQLPILSPQTNPS